jgi:hypothetical protein
MYAKILAAGKQKQQGREILAASCNAATSAHAHMPSIQQVATTSVLLDSKQPSSQSA